jgi:hypothetical protein
MKQLLLFSTLLLLVLFSKAQNSAQWAVNYSGDAAIFKTVIDNEGSIYSQGRLFNRDSIDFEPGTGAHIYTNIQDLYFITKHDSLGNFEWVVFINQWMHMEFLGNKLFLSNAIFGRIFYTNPAGTQSTLGTFSYQPYAFLLVEKNGHLVTSQFYDTNSGHFFVYDSKKGVDDEVVFSGVFSDTINFGFFYTLIDTNPWESHFIMRQDKFGIFKMARALDFGSATIDFPLQVSSDSLKNVFYALEFSGDIDIDPSPNINNVSSDGALNLMILKYDTIGDLVQNWHLKSRDGIVQAIDFDLDGSFLIAGELKDSLNLSLDSTENWIYKTQNSECFIAYYNQNGVLQWYKKIIGSASFRNCLINKNGDIYLYGSFNSSLNLDPGNGNYTLNSNSFFASTPDDDFLVRYTENGDFLGALRLSAFEESIGSITLGPDNDIYVNGWFYGVMSSPSTGLNSLNWQLSFHNSPFILKAKNLNVALNQSVQNNKLNIFPNPGNGLFQIQIPDNSLSMEYKVLSLSGTIIQEGLINDKQRYLDLTSMKTGMYIFIADDGKNIYRQKLVKN